MYWNLVVLLFREMGRGLPGGGGPPTPGGGEYWAESSWRTWWGGGERQFFLTQRVSLAERFYFSMTN